MLVWEITSLASLVWKERKYFPFRSFFLHFPCRISIARSWPIPVVLFPNIDTTAASAALMFSPTLLRCCGQKVLQPQQWTSVIDENSVWISASSILSIFPSLSRSLLFSQTMKFLTCSSSNHLIEMDGLRQKKCSFWYSTSNCSIHIRCVLGTGSHFSSWSKKSTILPRGVVYRVEKRNGKEMNVMNVPSSQSVIVSVQLFSGFFDALVLWRFSVLDLKSILYGRKKRCLGTF